MFTPCAGLGNSILQHMDKFIGDKIILYYRNGLMGLKILVLTSVYPQIDDDGEVVTPTVKYFSEKWYESGNDVIVIHNNSCFPGFFYIVPKKIRDYFASKLGHTFPTKKSRGRLIRQENGVKIYRLPMVKYIPYGRFSNREITKQVADINKILDNEGFKPDMILGHWVNPQIELIKKLSTIYPNAKTSLVFHNDCSETKIKNFDLLNSVKNFSAIGCRNLSYAKHVKESLKLDKLPFVCYSGIPDEQADKQVAYKYEKNDFIYKKKYLYVGRLIKYKNVDTILNALSVAHPNKDFTIDIVGIGAEREYLEQLSVKLGIYNNVVFHGQISREQVMDLMRQSYCFTMVSDNETFGMVYIEAMLAGCITVASKNGGIDGVIIDGVNGFLSKQGDAKELSRIYKRMSDMEEGQIRILRENAIKTALNFRDSKVAEKYLKDVLTWKE